MAVARLSSHLMALQCPPSLRVLQGWVLWRYEAGDGPKPRKVPYYADGGRRHGVQGRREDRLRMVAFDAAVAAAARRGFDGVGLCLLPEFGVVAVDFDNVVGPQGLRPDVAALVSDTYADFSPGGSGVHAYFRGQLGNHKSHGAPYGLETFSSTGFVTFTGATLPHVADLELAGPVDLAPVPERVRQVCAARFGARAEVDDDPLMSFAPKLDLTEAQITEALEVLPADCGHDDWLRVGMALHHETGGQGFHLWDQWSAGGGDKYPGTDLLQRRWESFGREGGTPVTARSLVKMANEAGARIVVGGGVLTAEELATPVPADGKALRFQFQQAGQYLKRKPLEWLIRGVLPAADLGVVYGASGAGKSFLALDLCLAIAQGSEWRGRKVRAGAVAYVVAEGAGGFTLRLRAAAEHHGVDLGALPLWVLGDQPNLLEKADVKDLVAALRALDGLVLVVLDTLAQVTPGANENSGEDMGRALAHCRAIKAATGAMVLLVGHSGKDAARGVRGWSGIKGALDVEIEVERAGEHRAATVTKMKDGTGEGDEFAFQLHQVVLGQDDEGEDVSSCVVTSSAGAPAAARRTPKGAVQQLVLRTARALLDLGGELQVMTLVDQVVQALPHDPEPGKRDKRREHAMRALEALAGAGFVSTAGGMVGVL